jgi:hypothetical protein
MDMSQAPTDQTYEAPDTTSESTRRKRLILFVAVDPAEDPAPLKTAMFWASVAAEAGLEAEVRLAANAVRALQPGHVADSEVAALLEQGPPSGVVVSVCPRAMGNFDIGEDAVRAIGGRPRTLAEILTEVAEGRSVLIPITHGID